MADAKVFTWKVEGTIPPDDAHRYAQNMNLQVIAASLENAVAATRERFPEFTFHKCWRDRWINDVIVVDTSAGRVSEER